MQTETPTTMNETRRIEGIGALADGQAVFFQVSVKKLVIMFFVTMGLYQIYWFYKHWSIVQERECSTIWPIARAIFSLFFCYGLFGRIYDSASAQGITLRVPAGGIAILYILGTVFVYLPDDFWVWVSFIVVPFSLALIQDTANKLCVMITPNLDRNSNFSGWNILAIVTGGLLLLLAAIGSFFPADV